jgi:hypothetical protein
MAASCDVWGVRAARNEESLVDDRAVRRLVQRIFTM